MIGTGAPGDAAGHGVVRPFIMTRGRTRSQRGDLRFETMVQRRDAQPPGWLPSEQAALLHLAETPVSIVELAARLDLVVGVLTVLVDDLLERGLLQIATGDDDVELDMLTAIADRIRSL